MTHNKHTESDRNQDLDTLTREDYMKMSALWKDPLGVPTVTEHDGIKVVRDDLHEFGAKGRFGDLLVSQTPEDTLVYVAPRVGMAGISLSRLAKRYNKKLVLFMPAAREASDHQRVAIELGADPRFVKVAAMPNLGKIAKKFAEDRGAAFLPLGLKHPLVTAAIVRTAHTLMEIHGEPAEFWTAISTGVLNRGLQIGWPNATSLGVAVARNIQDGEKGRASLRSHPLMFQQAERPELRPPFPSMQTYDAKAWRFVQERIIAGQGSLNTWFYNVAGELPKPDLKPGDVDSDRKWGDLFDVEK